MRLQLQQLINFKEPSQVEGFYFITVTPHQKVKTNLFQLLILIWPEEYLTIITP